MKWFHGGLRGEEKVEDHFALGARGIVGKFEKFTSKGCNCGFGLEGHSDGGSRIYIFIVGKGSKGWLWLYWACTCIGAVSIRGYDMGYRRDTDEIPTNDLSRGKQLTRD